jgi:hypothetical protein
LILLRDDDPPPSHFQNSKFRYNIQPSRTFNYNNILLVNQQLDVDGSDTTAALEAHNNDRWWYTGDSDNNGSPPQHRQQHYEEWRPHGQGQRYAVPGDPLHALVRRLVEFDIWLSQRPEQNIMIVAHWGVFKHLSS